jgi:cyclic lactone autoinducer peptide
MKRSLKYLLCSVALVGTLFFAATSAFGCWCWVFHQRECPKSLIKID